MIGIVSVDIISRCCTYYRWGQPAGIVGKHQKLFLNILFYCISFLFNLIQFSLILVLSYFVFISFLLL